MYDSLKRFTVFSFHLFAPSIDTLFYDVYFATIVELLREALPYGINLADKRRKERNVKKRVKQNAIILERHASPVKIKVVER